MSDHRISRRTALTMGGTLAIAAGLDRGLKAQAPPASGRRIDVHHHYFVPSWMAKRKDQNGEAFSGTRLTWTPAQSLEVMDKTGCSVAIAMIGGPGCWDGKDTIENNRKVAREIN